MVLLAVAKENNLDIQLVETDPFYPLSNTYLKLNPLKRVPTFEAPDGWAITEVIAIALYFTSQNEKTTLLGKTKREYAEIVRWMSFINSEIQPCLANWFKPLIGKREYNEENIKKGRDGVNEAMNILETHLRETRNVYLIGGEITLADLFAASSLSRGFSYVFDRDWQETYPFVTKWFQGFINQPVWKAVVPEPVVVEKAVEYTPREGIESLESQE